MSRRAVFIDRDGTLAHEVGYINHLSRFRLYPWAVDAVRLLNRGGLLAVVVMRSEERRVGKECYALCRSRWSPYH